MSEASPLEGLLGAELACYCASPYDSAAVRWLLGGELHPGGDGLSRRLAQLAGVRPGWRVLDVATGSGPTARLLVAEFGAYVTGVDRSRQAIAAARAEAEAAALGDRLRFVQGAAETLPVTSGAFDAVVCECALCLFPDKPRAITEMRRALRPSGVVAIADVTAELDALPAPLPAPQRASHASPRPCQGMVTRRCSATPASSSSRPSRTTAPWQPWRSASKRGCAWRACCGRPRPSPSSSTSRPTWSERRGERSSGEASATGCSWPDG